VNNKKVNITNLSISAKVTRVKVRQIDKFTYAWLTRNSVDKVTHWDWDISYLVDVKYPDGHRKIQQPEISNDLSGILIQDVDSMSLRVDGQIQKDFASQIKFATKLEISPQDIFLYQHAMIEISEDVVNFELEIDGSYWEEKIECEISRLLLAINVESDFIYPLYDGEIFIPKNAVETEIQRSYLVDDVGNRTLLTRTY
jgi:hypothetical protein